ncbi:MAG: efflux RND transporter periplasmic adaptor subunit [Candidatus Paceibacterota bacterium]
MKLILKKSKSIFLITGIVVIAGILFVQAAGNGETNSAEDNQSTSQATAVTVYEINTSAKSDRITTSGTVESYLQASLTAESGGQVQQVMVDIGDRVGRGEVLVRLSSDDQQASLAQAEAGLMSQEARLNELRVGARPAELRNSELSRDEARRAFLNTDLQAYVEDEDTFSSRGTFASPQISGVYNSLEEGAYNIELYRSGSVSGYSFRYTGLETGVAAVRTDIPQALGSRGLFIEFPENFATNRDLEWVVPIPNTRSSQYTQARTNFQRADNNLEIATDGARVEQIQAQEAAVAQARAGVDAARSQLAKKTIRAPFAGEVTAVRVNIGEYVSPGQTVVELVDADNLQVTTYVSSQEAKRISVGDAVIIDDRFNGRVANIAAAIDTQTGKIEMTIEITDSEAQLIVGDFVPVEILAGTRESGQTAVPLTAVKNDSQGAYVLRINNDGVAERVVVETGRISGDSVVITDSLSGTIEIIRDARQVTAGTAVKTN